MKYTGWGTTLFGLLMIALFAGRRVDAYFGNEKPYVALVLMLLVMVIQFYRLIKDLG